MTTQTFEHLLAAEDRRTGYLFGRYRRLSEAYDAYKRGVFLKEAVTTADFPELLKDGLRTAFFSEFAGIPSEWDQLAQVVPSNREVETWMSNRALGSLSRVGEGTPYPQLQVPDMRPEKTIFNFKYGGLLDITDEMLRFDKLGVMQENIRDLALAAAQTREEQVFTVLTATGNFDATSSDNQIGNNTFTTGLSPTGFDTAYTTLMTMFDRNSKRPLMVRPDTIVVAPKLWLYAKQLLGSPQTTGMGDADATVVFGMGSTNPRAGLVRIMSSTWLGSLGTSHHWLLCQAKRGLLLQEIEPLQLLEESPTGGGDRFTRDVYRYRVRDWFGVGIRDSRYWVCANSTTAGTIN